MKKKKCYVKDEFGHGMDVDTTEPGLSISLTANVLGFSCTTVSINILYKIDWSESQFWIVQMPGWWERSEKSGKTVSVYSVFLCLAE